MFFSKPKTEPSEPFFLWSDTEHSVGVTRFDLDHRRIAELLNHVHTVLVKQRDRTQAVDLMEQLIAETRAHFHREELALADAGFPDLEAHQEEHGALIMEAQELVRKFKTGNVSALALPTFLKNWLISHIKGSDRKYAACLRRHEPLR